MIELPEQVLITVTQEKGGRPWTISHFLIKDHRYINGSFLQYVAHQMDWKLYQECGFVSPDRWWWAREFPNGDASRLLDDGE